MTWPLARLMDRAVSDPGDPFITIWILDWGHYATFHRPLSLFNANAFYPARLSFAFSENLYGIALVLIPFRLIGLSAIFTHNIAVLLGFAFSGFGAYLLALRLTGSFAGALAAGTLYAFVPFRFTHLSHVQHLWGGWIPLLLLGLIAYVDRPSWRTAMFAGVAFLMNGLTNVHWLFFGTFATAASALAFHLSGFREWRRLLIALAVATLALLPFLSPYAAAAKLYGLTRTWEETSRFSAVIGDWLAASDSVPMHRGLVNESVDPERRLFPGFIPIALTLGGAIFLRSFPRAVVLGALWIAIGVAGSLGLNFVFHEFLFDAVPGFRAIRVPARWSSIAYAGMSMLIAVAFARFGRSGPAIAAPVAIAVMFVELRAAPIRWYLTNPDPPASTRWLAEQNFSGAILELPMDHVGSEYRSLLRSVHHHKPLFNGVSGFTPPFTADLAAMAKSDPIPDAFLEALLRNGCDFIVVHADQLGEFSPSTRDWLRRELARGRLHFVRRFDAGVNGDWIFATKPHAASSRSDLQTFLAGGWTRNEATFGLMDPPPRVVRGEFTFGGFALSPQGVRGVDLLFAHGAVRVPAELRDDARLARLMPWYPQTTRSRFQVTLRRPRGVPERTDVQAEVTDGGGRKTRLEHMWFQWEERR